MSFASPLYLFALLPWAALVIWLLWGRRQRVDVPFVELWRGPVKGPRAKRAVQVPPVALALAIVALLCAVVAMARPRVGWLGKSGPEVVVVVDRGLTMPPARLKEAANAAQTDISRTLGNGPTRFVVVPDGRIDLTSRDALADVVSKFTPTALDTSMMLQQAITDAIQSTRDSDAPILVLSDRSIPIENSRMVQIVPPTPLNDVAIGHLGVRAFPRPQAMVRITNRSPQRRARLKIDSGGRSVTKEIELPPTGASRNEFVDLPALGETVSASIDVHDDIALNNAAYLTRASSFPRLEARFPVPPELQRMIDVYGEARPPVEGSRTVALIDEAKSTPAATTSPRTAEATILIPPVGDAKLPTADRIADLQVTSHAITADVNWNDALRGAALAASPAPTGWQVLIRAAGHPILAIRPDSGDDAAPRAAWVGFHSAQFARSSDFPVFWGRLFDWVGRGGDVYSSDLAVSLPGDWIRLDATGPFEELSMPGLVTIPGLYSRSDGLFGAFNAAALPENLVERTDWRSRLDRLTAAPDSPRSAASGVLLLALILTVASAWFWRSKPQLDRIFGAS